MDSSTSAFISSSSSGVGARSSIPSTCLRVQVWPAKKPTLGAISSDEANSSSGHGWSPEWSDAMSVVIPCRRKFSDMGCPAMLCWTWAWLSTKPGVTTRPVASMTWRASEGSMGVRETATIRSPEMATSASKRASPVPSTTVPPRIRTS